MSIMAPSPVTGLRSAKGCERMRKLITRRNQRPVGNRCPCPEPEAIVEVFGLGGTSTSSPQVRLLAFGEVLNDRDFLLV